MFYVNDLLSPCLLFPDPESNQIAQNARHFTCSLCHVYLAALTGFIPNLETWKVGHFHEKSGRTWNSQGNFCNIQVRENKLFSSCIILINSSMAIRKVVASFAVSRYKLYHFA